MDRRLAAEGCPRELAAAVGDDLVHVHVELRAAAGHPHVQRKHVVMLAREDLVARLNDEFVSLVVETLAGVVGCGRGLFQDRVGGDHLTPDQILPDPAMFERTMSLGAPELIGRDFDHAQAICFFPCDGHDISSIYTPGLRKLVRTGTGIWCTSMIVFLLETPVPDPRGIHVRCDRTARGYA